MKKTVLSASICLLILGCKPSEQTAKVDTCDTTGKRYSEMMKNGEPLNAKDQACIQAAMLKGFVDAAKKTQDNAKIIMENDKAKNIMGDGNKPMPKPGENLGGL